MEILICKGVVIRSRLFSNNFQQMYLLFPKPYYSQNIANYAQVQPIIMLTENVMRGRASKRLRMFGTGSLSVD